MMQAIREHITVKPGGLIEIYHPELTVGTEAEIIIMVETPVTQSSLSSFIGKGKGCFANASAIDTFLR